MQSCVRLSQGRAVSSAIRGLRLLSTNPSDTQPAAKTEASSVLSLLEFGKELSKRAQHDKNAHLPQRLRGQGVRG